MKMHKKPLAWVVGADMGYGHLRAVHALRHIACEEVLAVGKNDAAGRGEALMGLLDDPEWPVRQMAYHHLVEDTVGGVPLVSTY